MTRLWRDYVRAFADCSAWLASWCLPWRWIHRLHAELAHPLRAEAVR